MNSIQSALKSIPIENLTRIQKLLLVTAVIVVITLAIVQSVILGPVAIKTASLESTLRELQEKSALVRQADQAIEALQEAKAAVPIAGTTTTLLQELTELAALKGVSLEAVSPRPSANLGEYVILSIEVDANGSFSEMIAFIRALETDPPIYRVERATLVAIKPPREHQTADELGSEDSLDEAAQNQVRVELRFSAFMAKEK